MMHFNRKLAALLSVLLCLSAPCAAALDITATSAYVMDYDTGETLYAQNADLRRTPASMTKVLTSYIVYQELEKGSLTLDTQVPISAHSAAISRDGAYPLSVPLTAPSYTVDTLLSLLHVPSASGACVALAEYIAGSESAFVERMNQTAATLGLDAVYYNVHGCGPNKITARAQAQLTRHFIRTYPDVLRYTTMSSVEFEGKTYTNGNTLVNGSYLGCDGFKTGTFGDSGYCLSSTAQRGGHRVIAIAMNADSRATRISDSAQLLDLGFAEIEQRDVSRQATRVTLTAPSAQATQFAPLSVEASLSGLTVPYTAKAEWLVDGVPVPGYANADFRALNGVASALTYAPNAVKDGAITVSFVLTMPDGTKKSAETTIPVQQAATALHGRLNLHTVKCYPGTALPVEASVYTDAPRETLYVSAAWRLDGQPIPGYANPMFRIENGYASSVLPLSLPQDMPAGLHTLSLTLAEGSDAACTLSCEIVVLEDALAA